ncbi:MerR family transcriptional regulator [Streptomyces sp. NBRC 109706]|uniref:MerR family transcriptional regulator n=1 Tax=Streptomyces sp. NBRC 109706 TaxID=1550035 RepID=UPI000B301822|nr:MerR family transcriptional regulator [Streptomyces sp. NBRC 109706]
MRIGEAARVSGVSVRALRYYEDEGLIVPGRHSNGYRDYCRPTIDRVRTVRALLASGLPVRLVREALPAVDDGGRAVSEAEFLAEVAGYRDRLAARIAELQARQAALDAFLRDSGA